MHITESLIEKWQAYKNPLLLGIISTPIHRLFGVTIECSRCGVPPMTTLQKILFTLAGIESIVIPIWIVLIYIRRKYERDGHLD